MGLIWGYCCRINYLFEDVFYGRGFVDVFGLSGVGVVVEGGVDFIG